MFQSIFLNTNTVQYLVGPNNAGKSAVIGALKILSEGIRKAGQGNQF
jgi:predicted ATPase